MRGKHAKKGATKAQPPVRVIPPPSEKGPTLMSQPWAPHYAKSAFFGPWWEMTQSDEGDWPPHVQLMNGKMYHFGKLCVPENLVQPLLWAFHSHSGHVGVQRCVKEAQNRFEFPPSIPFQKIIEGIRRACNVCQACEPPHHAKLGLQNPFPVPERVMHSVCLDIFAMPSTQWRDIDYDAILLCVDRLSGWIVACPTLKQGLTAEKAAHLLLEKGWEPFGLPTTVHSDQGAQFVGQWWGTLCAMLGVQQTFSQPHRPRANGRAERAGQQILSVLKKLHVEHGWNWVQALPRALMIHHDMVGESGYSPYHIMFGRDRPLQGIPYIPERECEDAVQFVTRMEKLDKTLAQKLNQMHVQDMEKANQGHSERPPFEKGTLVWVLKSDTLDSGAKIEARWRGPLQIMQRVGARSYIVGDKKGRHLAVHVDQLKPYITLGEVEELKGLPLNVHVVQKVMSHRSDPIRGLELLIWWQGQGERDAEWVGHSKMVKMGLGPQVQPYIDHWC